MTLSNTASASVLIEIGANLDWEVTCSSLFGNVISLKIVENAEF
jgi:hypothetical protein